MKKYKLILDVDADCLTSKEASDKGYYIGGRENEDGFEIKFPLGFHTWLPYDDFSESFVCLDTPERRMAYKTVTLLYDMHNISKYEGTEEYSKLDRFDKALLSMEKSTLSDYAYITRRKQAQM